MQSSRVLARRPCAVFFAGGVQLSSAERDGASGEILPGGAVSAEGLHVPGGGPGGVTAGGADVQCSQRLYSRRTHLFRGDPDLEFLKI
jgi:hypothetical protein